MADKITAETCNVLYKIKVKEYKERCVKTDFY
jgi:hypothetical protein